MPQPAWDGAFKSLRRNRAGLVQRFPKGRDAIRVVRATRCFPGIARLGTGIPLAQGERATLAPPPGQLLRGDSCADRRRDPGQARGIGAPGAGVTSIFRLGPPLATARGHAVGHRLLIAGSIVLLLASRQSCLALLVAISQCAPYRSGSRCVHCVPVSFCRNWILGRVSRHPDRAYRRSAMGLHRLRVRLPAEHAFSTQQRLLAHCRRALAKPDSGNAAHARDTPFADPGRE